MGGSPRRSNPRDGVKKGRRILIAPMGAELGWNRSEIVAALTISSLIAAEQRGGF